MMDYYFKPSESSNILTLLCYLLVIFSQLLHLTLSNDHPHYIPIHPDDKKVLIRIQKQLGNNNAQPWTSMTQCCQFFCFLEPAPEPIECTADGHIRLLSLTFNSPTSCTKPAAVIPTVLGDLVSLTDLVLWGPYFTSPIPMGRVLRQLTNLTSLYIHNTSITGPIPGTLLGMENLISLKLSNNKFLTGRIPKALTKLTSLVTLDLSSNRLSGPIPSFLDRMSNLRWVNLKSNRFSGPIPTSLGRLTMLRELDLSHNQLIGTIPESFGSFNSNVILSLNDNRLTGSVPRAIAGAMVWKIDVSNNELTDASHLFENIDYFFEASTINLSYNRLKFNFSNAHFSEYLYDLNISHNTIYGSLPTELESLFLDSIDVSYNQLCGPIPTSRVSLKQFSPSNFAHNKCLCGAPLAPCK